MYYATGRPAPPPPPPEHTTLLSRQGRTVPPTNYATRATHDILLSKWRTAHITMASA